MVTRRRMLMVPPAVAAAVVAGPRDAGAHRAGPAPEPVHRGPWIRAPYDTYVRNPLVARNTFLSSTPDAAALPTFDQARRLLPEPFWDGHASGTEFALGGGKLAFANLPPAAAGERIRGAVHRPGVQ